MNKSIESVPASKQSVLITRPAAQNERLLRMLAGREVRAAAIPFMDLTPIEPEHKSLCILRDLAQPPVSERGDANDYLLGRPDVYDNILFVSANAVHYTAEALQSIQSAGAATALQRIPCIGMGSATASAIERQGWLLDQQTMQTLPKAFTSEVLLESKWADQVHGKRILISRGVGGRETLRMALGRKGAIVDHLETYERGCPHHDLGLLKGLLEWCMYAGEMGQSLSGPTLRIVVLGSAETAKNFLSQLLRVYLHSSPYQNRSGLKQVLSDCYLVVPSARVAQEITNYFSADSPKNSETAETLQLCVAKNASDEAIADVVIEISRQHS